MEDKTVASVLSMPSVLVLYRLESDRLPSDVELCSHRKCYGSWQDRKDVSSRWLAGTDHLYARRTDGGVGLCGETQSSKKFGQFAPPRSQRNTETISRLLLAPCAAKRAPTVAESWTSAEKPDRRNARERPDRNDGPTCDAADGASAHVRRGSSLTLPAVDYLTVCLRTTHSRRPT